MRAKLGLAAAAVVVLIFFGGQSAEAQVGPGLVLFPAEAPNELEHATLRYEGAWARRRNGQFLHDLEADRHVGQGRFTLGPATLGLTYDLWRLNHSDLDEHHELTRMEFNLAAPVDDQDRLTLFGGAGYAGDEAFTRDGALYPRAGAIYEVPLATDTRLLLMVDYHANRMKWNEYPLPGIVYERTWPGLTMGLGVPVAYVDWQLLPQLRLKANAELPLSAYAKLSYDFAPGWSLYGRFDHQLEAYTVGRDHDRNRRSWFREMRAEGGLQWQPTENVELVIGAGQAFERGMDVRDLNMVAQWEDAPYLRVGLRISF